MARAGRSHRLTLRLMFRLTFWPGVHKLAAARAA